MTGQPAMQPASIRYESGSLHWNNTTTTTTVPEREELGMGLVGGGEKKEVRGVGRRLTIKASPILAWVKGSQSSRSLAVAGWPWLVPASHGGEQKWQKSKREPSHVTSKPSTIASERRGVGGG